MQRLPSSSDNAWWDRFQSLLDDQIDWPSAYLFKFIVPREEVGALTELFDEEAMKMRSSRKGNYISVTAQLVMQSSDDVIAVYKAAAEVDGVISL